MQAQKPITKSFMLNSDNDTDILDYLARPEISISAAVREGLRLLIHQEETVQTFEVKAIQLLEQIIGALAGGVAIEAPPTSVYDDEFLDTSL